jgi:NAD(P)-dependent dehydrogenase (short-subunit alcohol dehydrogenase family)
MVNMVGPLLFTELLLPRMKASGAGKILIVASNMHSPEQKSPLKLKQVGEETLSTMIWSPVLTMYS